LYKHYIPELNLSIEKNTENVPDDGRFHVVKAGKIIKSFSSRKLAEKKFKQLLEESGFKPEQKHTQQTNPSDEAIERYLISKAIFWAEGPKYKKKGGRGGRGGV